MDIHQPVILMFGIINFNFTAFTLKGCAIIPQDKQGMHAGLLLLLFYFILFFPEYFM
jgi:hypothetical protein